MSKIWSWKETGPGKDKKDQGCNIRPKATVSSPFLRINLYMPQIFMAHIKLHIRLEDTALNVRSP